MTRPIVLATQPMDQYAETVLGRFGDCRVASDMSELTLRREITEAVALVVRGQAPVTAAVMDAAPNLKVIGRTGVGYDTIDIPAATARGIPVVHTPGVGARAVAEAAVAFMLALCKMIPYWDEQLKGGNWNARYGIQGKDLDSKTVGIVGFGRIGKLVAELLSPFQMTILAHDPVLDAQTAQRLNVTIVGMDELLERSDFLTLHLPEDAKTMGFINRDKLSRLKKGSYLINLARGGVIESLDLIDEFLTNGHLGGAALDVFNQEPPNLKHPIFRHKNILVSPHAMATTESAMRRIFKSMSDDMSAILEGRAPQHVVNREVLKS